MTKTNALPRPVGATVLSLLAIALAALVLPAASLAAPEGAPLLKISSAPVTLPKTTVGNSSQVVEFDVANEGEVDALIANVAIEGPDQGAFVLNMNSCALLGAGQHCAVGIAFQPGEPRLEQATLSFKLMGAPEPEQNFEISGTGVLPQLSFTPGSHDFGLQQVNRGGSGAGFQLTNSGEAAVQVNNLEVSRGSNAFWVGNSDCWGRWLAPSESCSVEVDFGPRDTVAYEAELRAWANGNAFGAALSGGGGQAVVEASENPVDFGAGTVGSTGPVRTITLTNSGNLPAGFFIGVIAGGDAGSFRLLDESCSGEPLMPGASCAAHVRFTPQDAGPKVARLAFFGEAEGGTMVALRGEGVAPAVTLLPDGYDFGGQELGAKSAPRSFAVRNDGDAPVELAGVSIAGADLDQFALAGEECSGTTLAPRAECQVRVRFAPDSAGAKAATLRVGSDAGAFTAALSGWGEPARVDVPVREARSHAGAGRHRLRYRFRRGRAISALSRHRNLTRARAASPRG